MNEYREIEHIKQSHRSADAVIKDIDQAVLQEKEILSLIKGMLGDNR